MPQNNLNLTLIFGVAFASLATGYYLGQTVPRFVGEESEEKNDKQSILRKCIKSAVTIEKEDYSDDEEYSNDDYEVESLTLNDVPGEVRMALVIRQDLKMQKGKIAAQCCHAALSCFKFIAMDEKKKSYNPIMTQ